MGTEIAQLDLQNRRRSTIGYAAGTALYMLVIVALYPALNHSTGLDTLITDNPTIAAMFGVTGSLSSPAGWVDAAAYTTSCR
jgi:ABC-2 type transport system permease protein